MAPKARIRENRLFVEDRERLTSAGITAGIDLMLHIVAQMAGSRCALAVARYLVVSVAGAPIRSFRDEPPTQVGVYQRLP